MNFNLSQPTVVVTVFVLLFNPKYEEKEDSQNDYLIVYDRSNLLIEPEDWIIYGEWNDNKSVRHLCYDILESEIAVKPKSDSHGDNMNNNGEDTKTPTNPSSQNNATFVTYRVITLPISKVLYEKILHLSWASDTRFTFDEICDLLTMLPRFFDKEALIMFCVFKTIVNDTNLFLKLNQFFSENISKQGNTCLSHRLNWYDDVRMCFYENGYLVLKDQFGNVIRTADDYEQQYKVPIYIDSTSKLFPPIPANYLAVDYKSLQNSSFDLSITYHKKSGLTLDIDFTGFFIEKNVAETCTSVTEDRIQSERLNDFYRLLNNPLLSSEYVNVIVLRISSVSYNFNFDFILTKEIHLYCDDCIFGDKIRFPVNLTILIINNSKINTKLELPQRLDMVSMKNCRINTENSLFINENYTEVIFCGVRGNIFLPSNWNLQAIEFRNTVNKIINVRKNRNGFFEIFRILGVKINDDIELGRNIKVFHLENVQIARNVTFKIHRSYENITLKNCAGRFDLTDFAKWLKFEIEKNWYDFSLTIKTERNKCKKSIKSIELYMDINQTAKFEFFRWIMTNDKLSSQNDNNYDMKTQYHISNSLELLFLYYIKVISGFKPSYNSNLYLSVNEENSVLTVRNIITHKNVLIDGFKKISLDGVKTADDQVLKITSKYSSLILEYCMGRFVVPGIQLGQKEYLYLYKTNFIQFYEVEEDVYSFQMRKIGFGDKLLIWHKIRTAQLTNSELCENIGLEFKYGCEILHLTNTKGVIISSNNRFKRIILRGYDQSFPTYYVSYSAYEIIISSCHIDHHALVFTDSTKRIQLYSVKFTKHSIVIINHECENIIIRNTTGHFIISNIIKTSLMHEVILYLYYGIFVFEKNLAKNQLSLSLERVVIEKCTNIRENIHMISLTAVTLHKHVVLRINDDCEVLSIESCNGNIDFSRCTGLKSLTIKNYKFIYHKNIYDNLLSLHLENVKINTTVRLGKNIKTIKLVEVMIGWFKSIQICGNCQTVYVCDFAGRLEIPSIFNCRSKIFTQKTMTITYEVISGMFGRTMFLDNVYLEKDYEISSNVESVILWNFRTHGDVRLKINEACKYLKLNVYRGCIDVSKTKYIEKVIFLRCLPTFGDDLWEFSRSCKRPIDVTGKRKINLPNNIENVIIKKVKVASSHLVVVNENCQSVTIISSEGDFDLSKVRKLKAIKLLDMKQGLINIQFPDLNNVTTLEVSLSGDAKYFNLLLSKCINAKKLVLYNTVCELHDWIQKESLLSYREEMIPWRLDELKSMVELESHIHPCRSARELISDFIIHSKPIFDHNRQTIITDLSIIAFQIDNECLKQLKRFVMLKRLSIVAQITSDNLFDALPFSIHDFSLMLIPCYITPNLKIVAARNLGLKEKNTKNVRLINFQLDGFFFINMDLFRSFPQKVDVLEVMPLVKVNDIKMRVGKKMKVRRLIIMEMNSRTRDLICKDWILEEYFDHLLNVFSEYIDFGSVEEIKILDRDTEKLVDPRNYSTNQQFLITE
ncbi:putative LRR containing protein [Trachipleistophora hominis]|uniref:Putative LRR containing protein n=1 Tax=Trachipleistophora hominis TaxID=72359 RepID=L7JSJ0_TRAHO|nr:putative LRR containing protein [Trachipleistophora hominis]